MVEVFGLSLSLFLIATILLALFFDYSNGFHDSANAIATVVATKVLTPGQAVVMAAAFNFIGPFVFTLAVAKTVGKGIIDPAIATAPVIFAALTGAVAWNLLTWWWGMPSSSSHALVGGLVGSALAAVGPAAVIVPTADEIVVIGTVLAAGALIGIAFWLIAAAWSRARLSRRWFPAFSSLGLVGGIWLGTLQVEFGVDGLFDAGLVLLTFGVLGLFAGALLFVMTQRELKLSGLPPFPALGAALAFTGGLLSGVIKLGGLTKTLVFIFMSPILGFFAGFLLVSVVSYAARDREPAGVESWTRKLQVGSAAFYALTHGTNDAQKTMGVIAALLFGAGVLGGEFFVPDWVVFTSALAIGLGTLSGGWRIVHTMANKITLLRPYQGFSAETASAVVLSTMAHAGIPVSTTHAISASIMGVGAARRASAVRWGVGRRMIGAWITTIPAAAAIAFVAYLVLSVTKLGF